MDGSWGRPGPWCPHIYCHQICCWCDPEKMRGHGEAGDEWQGLTFGTSLGLLTNVKSWTIPPELTAMKMIFSSINRKAIIEVLKNQKNIEKIKREKNYWMLNKIRPAPFFFNHSSCIHLVEDIQTRNPRSYPYLPFLERYRRRKGWNRIFIFSVQ